MYSTLEYSGFTVHGEEIKLFDADENDVQRATSKQSCQILLDFNVDFDLEYRRQAKYSCLCSTCRSMLLLLLLANRLQPM